MEIRLPKLEKWQKDVYLAMSDSYHQGETFTVVSKRQVGKTVLASALIVKFALEYKSTIMLVEPTLNQSRRVYQQLVDMLTQARQVYTKNASLLNIYTKNGSCILFKSAEQSDALRGYTLDFLVVDEAAFIQDAVFEILFPCVDARKASMLVISTPLFSDGMFYKLYSKGVNRDIGYRSFNWSKYDTSKYLTPEKLEMYRQTLSSQKFQSEYLGQFLDNGSFVFGDIRSCIKEDSMFDHPPVYCGIDWACGVDGDSTVLTFMDEQKIVVAIDRFNNLDANMQLERIVNRLTTFPSLKVVQVEKNSIGSIFYDLLVHEMAGTNIRIQPFVTSNESKRVIIEKLISAFNSRELQIPDNRELITELQHYTMQKTKLSYTYNALEGYHDDHVISLALAFDLFTSSVGNYKYNVNSYQFNKRTLTAQERYH